jgi:hypothetical protein
MWQAEIVSVEFRNRVKNVVFNFPYGRTNIPNFVLKGLGHVIEFKCFGKNCKF